MAEVVTSIAAEVVFREHGFTATEKKIIQAANSTELLVNRTKEYAATVARTEKEIREIAGTRSIAKARREAIKYTQDLAKAEAQLGQVARQQAANRLRQDSLEMKAKHIGLTREESKELAGYHKHQEMVNEMIRKYLGLSTVEADKHERIIALLKERERAQVGISASVKKLTVDEQSLNETYASSVWQVRGYGRGLGALGMALGGAGAGTEVFTGILNAATYGVTELGKAFKAAESSADKWAAVQANLKNRISGVNGSTITGIILVGALIAAYSLWQKGRESERERREGLLSAMKAENSEREKSIDLYYREWLAEKDILGSMNDLGITTNRLNQIISEGPEAVEKFVDGLKALGQDTKTAKYEYQDLINEVNALSDSYEKNQRMLDQINHDALLVALQDAKGLFSDLQNEVDGYTDAINNSIDAYYSQGDTVGRFIDLLQKRRDLEAEIEMNQRKPVAGRQRELQQEMADLERQIQTTAETARREGVDIFAAIEEERQRAFARGDTAMAAQMSYFLPEARVAQQGARDTANTIALAFQDALMTKLTEGANIISTALGGDFYDSGDWLGIQMSDGIVSGVDGLGVNLSNAINREISQTALPAIMEFFGIQSPSTYFADLVGNPIGWGIIEGSVAALGQMADQINAAIKAAQGVISYRQSQYSYLSAQDKVASAQIDVDAARMMAGELGGSTMTADSAKAIQDAERAWKMSKFAQMAGTATEADVMLAKQKYDQAISSAETYDDVVARLEMDLQKAQLAAQSAQLSIVNAFISMANAGLDFDADSEAAFRSFASGLGMPQDEIDSLVELMKLAAATAQEAGLTPKGSGGGGGGGESDLAKFIRESREALANLQEEIDLGINKPLATTAARMQGLATSNAWSYTRGEVDLTANALARFSTMTKEQLIAELGPTGAQMVIQHLIDKARGFSSALAQISGARADFYMKLHLELDDSALQQAITSGALSGSQLQASLEIGQIAFGQHGGKFGAGQPVVLGEKGPELFVPTSPGELFSNRDVADALANGGGGGGNNYYIEVPVTAAWPVSKAEARKVSLAIRESIRQLDRELR